MAITSISKLLVARRSDAELVPLGSPTTQLGASSISSVAGVSIGFDFVLDGTTYTTCYLSAFGFLRLAGTVTSSSNANLFSPNTNVVLAPWWDGMRTNSVDGYLKTEVQGTAPWRRFVVEWRNYLASGHTSTNNDTVVFQVVLHETSNKVEFRYGPRVRTGAPTTNAASVGVKGNTSVVATNYIDCSVDNRALGGSSSTSGTSLTYVDYDALVGMLLIEPAWPMAGRLFLLGDEDLTGLQDPYGEPAWKIANAVNWLWCHHRPALLSFAPQEQTAAASHEYVTTITTSADTQVTYELTVQVYASTGTTCTVTLYEDAAADPQPAVGGDWSSVATSTQAVSAGWNELVVSVPQFAADYARLTISVAAGTCLLGHAQLVPAAASDFDPTASYASGWLPMSLAMVRQQGAPVHPEWYNRAWQSIRAVLEDRVQVVWSSVWPPSTVVYSTTPKPERTLGVAQACLWSWWAQTVTVRAYMRGQVGNKVYLEELGGARAELEVSHATELRLVEASLELTSHEPLLTLTSRCGTGLYASSVTVEWTPTLSASDLILGVTPAPRRAYLGMLAARIERALRAYAIPGLAGLFARGKATSNKWHLSLMVPPAVTRLRPKVVRVAADLSAASSPTLIYAQSSGATAADEIQIPTPHSLGLDDFPPEGPIAVAAGSMRDDATPAAAMDRLLESPTAASMSGPVRERIEIARGVGFTAAPIWSDAATL